MNDSELERLREMDRVIWNYLGLRDPAKVRDWIGRARQELIERRGDSEPWRTPRPAGLD